MKILYFRMYAILLLSLLLIFISSCTPSLDCRIFNNTKYNIAAAIGSNVIHIKSHGYGNISLVSFGRQLKIESTLHAWTYRIQTIPDEFFSRNPFGNVASVQIESDGKIYVIQGEATKAVSIFPSQPNGYPLMPE